MQHMPQTLSNTTLVKVKFKKASNALQLALRFQIQHLLKLNDCLGTLNPCSQAFQIQHLLKLNKMARLDIVCMQFFQIQHLLKLNYHEKLRKLIKRT